MLPFFLVYITLQKYHLQNWRYYVNASLGTWLWPHYFIIFPEPKVIRVANCFILLPSNFCFNLSCFICTNWYSTFQCSFSCSAFFNLSFRLLIWCRKLSTFSFSSLTNNNVVDEQFSVWDVFLGLPSIQSVESLCLSDAEFWKPIGLTRVPLQSK